jgi:predicted ATPase/DNA-binding winged helix-turn-helix (wHTH) protein
MSIVEDAGVADRYAFAECEVRPAERQLLVVGAPTALGGRAFDLLVALIERRDRVVAKAELFDTVWPGLVVEENNLQVQVSSLRKLLGPGAIATVPGRGYRFVAPLRDESTEASDDRPRLAVVPTNLQAARTRFIGREKALADCAGLLRDSRLLTLSGIGGCGKTRLAQALAQREQNAYPDGVWFVDLAPLQDARGVATAVAAAIGITDGGDAPLERLVERLSARRTLIVLDNCEHVIDATVESIEAMLARSAGLKVIATSREALGVAGEQVFAVRSLSLPISTDLDEVRSSEAVRLFVDHARFVLPDFDVHESNAAVLADICRRLDGIALAIELAAARIRVLSVEDIQARLDDRFRLLTGGRRALPRHQTLQATMQWSHDHLTAQEQQLFRRLAVFAGGCTLGAAARVAADTGDEYEALERLTALHDKSLLIVDRDTAARPRYRMLETVRQYAVERLDESGEGDAVRTRHLEYFVTLAEEVASSLKGPHSEQAVAILRPDAENLLAALAWSGHAPQGGDLAVRLIGSAWRYWRMMNEPERGYRLAKAALELAGEGADSVPRYDATHGLAKFALATGRYGELRAFGEDCLTMARRMGDAELIASALEVSSVGFGVSGDTARALARYAECADDARLRRDDVRLANALHNAAEMHRGTGDLMKAQAMYDEALDIARRSEDRRSCISTLGGLAMLYVTARRQDDAWAALAECMSLSRETGDRQNSLCIIDTAATLAALLGEHATAARFHGAALARTRDSGIRHEPVDEAFVAPRIAAARAALGESAFDAARSAGETLGYDAVIVEVERWLASRDLTSEGLRSEHGGEAHRLRATVGGHGGPAAFDPLSGRVE